MKEFIIKRKKLIMIISMITSLLIMGLLGFLILSNKSDNDNQKAQDSSSPYINKTPEAIATSKGTQEKETNNNDYVFSVYLNDKELFIEKFIEFAKKRDNILKKELSTDDEYKKEASQNFDFQNTLNPLMRTMLRDGFTLTYSDKKSAITCGVKKFKLLHEHSYLRQIILLFERPFSTEEMTRLEQSVFIDKLSIKWENLQLLFKFFTEINISYVVLQLWEK